MGAKNIFFYWLLLLIPTLLIGGMALRLLKNESLRLEKVAVENAEEKARLAVDGIRLTVNGIKETLIEELESIDAENLTGELWAQEAENPFVRNVFVFSQDFGVQLPNLKEQRTAEKTEFIRRYESLFNGRRPWFKLGGDELPDPDSQVNNRAQLVQEVKQAVSRSKASYVGRKGNPASPSVVETIPTRSGWKPWIWEDQLYMLGFIHDPNQRRYYGIEMELITVLTRLYDALPRDAGPNEVFVLRDKNGRIFHQRGNRDLKAGEEPAVTVNVGTTLPHFEVAVFGVETGATAGGLGFFAVSSLLVGTFVTAIIIGGSLLILQAHRNLQDARQKTNFVSNVSHELKTPLTTIRMYAELLGEGRIKDEAKKNNYMSVIVDESQRLTRLVDNVLDFSRLEQGRKKYRLESIPVYEFMRNLADMQKVRMEKEGVDFHADCGANGTRITADRDALEQVLLNLIDNAVKYARGGGELGVAARRENGSVRIAITDRGPGVPRDQQKRIFEKFHRVDDSLTSAQAGSGLGLSIACRLVEDMGGNLKYEDRAGGGAMFTIELPAEEEKDHHAS